MSWLKENIISHEKYTMMLQQKSQKWNKIAIQGYTVLDEEREGLNTEDTR
jgi:hypothetical protein